MIEIGLTIFYILIGCFIISRSNFFKLATIPTYWIIIIFGIKIILSILITLIYTYYYSDRAVADIFKYFDDSKIMFDALKTNVLDYTQMVLGLDLNSAYFHEHYYSKMHYWNRVNNSNFLSDTHVMIRFNAIVRLFSFGFYHVHNVFINFLSLIGLIAIFKVFSKLYIGKEKLLFLIVFLTPSLLFWGSGLLKEGLVIIALGMLLLHFFKLVEKWSFISLFLIIFSCIIILFTKMILLIALIPGILGFLIHKKVKNIPLSYLYATVIVVATSLILYFINHSLNPIDIIINKQQDFIYLVEKMDVRSAIYQPKFNHLWDLLAYTPQALINVFLRPFLWESYSVFTLFSALENILIILFCVVLLFFRTKKTSFSALFYFSILFALVLAIVIGLTTPILGAIVRYKIFVLLFFLLAIGNQFDIDKFISFFNSLIPFNKIKN
ncbi:MAG: hypothetical protein OQJ96_12215 [Flavobacteriales bacterium]|nr:hypothetical protein [Flavobacteriales bacterium]MCW8913276.1 hypothetical protein [Flavobacteriales bacterium]MCW8938944.1 hypothetical protein [Flavobacteriales bacterium]MCW8939407.1 hypothetical protein [Flavobacteriales bacterium]MCW8968865.1 hypothetical protein [Flavobacteriales bacterium]